MGFINDVFFWRQSLILITDCIHSVGTGFILSFPAVLNPAILAANSTDITATPEQASWIAASPGFSGAIGFIVVPPLMQILGRRFAVYSINITPFVGFLLLALAKSIPALYAARLIQGVSICGVYITPIIIAEYADVKRRGYFIILKKVSVALGSLMCHLMPLFCNWRQIAIIAIVPHLISILITLLWPESPAFLALRGKYEECENSYIWLYGDTPKTRRDLEELISAQKEIRLNKKNENNYKFAKLIEKFMRRDFLKPFLIISLLTIIIDACGRYYMLVYIVEILKEITGDKSIANYCTIGADLLTIVALLVSCYVIRCFKRRTILFTAGIISACLMLLISFLTYTFTKNNEINIMSWIIAGVILLNVFIINVGVVPVCFAIIGEIFPLEHKGLGSCATGVVFTLLYASVLKLTPVLMAKTGIVGTFVIYAVCMAFCLGILFLILNETKDKTLQQIEDEIKGIKRTNSFLNADKKLLP